MQQLPKNTLLQGGKYRIEKVLGQGGFGITYLATQELLDRKVCIKEFFFKNSCSRTSTGKVALGTVGNMDLVERFLNKFIKEARTISKLEHPNIIRILDIFMENGTAYYVMDFIEGESLEDIVNSRGALPEHEAIGYIKQVANALDYLHQRKINHLDVKPANIMIRKKDNIAILIDFGVSKQYDERGEQTSTTPVGISHGYASMEQYNVGGVGTFSPQTDIYSLGATLYKLLTGNTPPQAIEIFNDGFPELPSSISQSIADVIKKTAFKITRMGQLVATEASRRLDVPFGIVDLSLAPTPAVGDSVAHILEGMGLEKCGTHGTTAALALLNDAVKKGGVMASSHVGGLSGAFIPVSEDAGMIDAVKVGALSIEKLEAMTAVCSVGLDMIAVPGDTPASTICGIIADEISIGVANTKTTAVRIIPAYGKGVGESVEFGGLLGYAPIMKLSDYSSADFINRGGRIPAPMHSLKN